MKRQIALFFLIVTVFISAALICVFLPSPAHAQATPTQRAAIEAVCRARGDCLTLSEGVLRELLKARYMQGLQDGCNHGEGTKNL